MADIPILFSAPMVRALLEGRKTMTRRILSLGNCEFGAFGAGKAAKLFWQEHAAWEGAWIDRGFPDTAGVYRSGYLHVPCHDDDAGRGYCTHCQAYGWAGTTHRLRPKVQVGDRLWVREAAAFIDNSQFGQPSHWQYRADTNGHDLPGDWPADEKYNPERPHWRPSIHMPRVASRITDIVTGVKIERLQDISEADAIAEGIALAFTDDECRTVVGITGTTPSDHGWTNYLWHGHVGRGITQAQADAWPHQFSTYKDPRGSFSSLWARINGPASWDTNPFVVVTSFRVVKANIDAPEARIAA